MGTGPARAGRENFEKSYQGGLDEEVGEGFGGVPMALLSRRQQIRAS